MVTLLDIQNLTKSFGDRLLFRDLCLSVGEGQHVGLIARNGTGKSTLLSIICGRDTAGAGTVITRRDLRIGYLEQTPHYDPALSVIDACFSQAGELSDLISRYERCLAIPGTPGIDVLIEEMERREGWDFELRARQILTKLRITDYDQPVGQLSGGELKRVALANVLLTNPDLLILDEPTNHLDLDMIEWLEDYLRRSGKALLMVTHDRYFLDRVCSLIVELADGILYPYRGNYAYYLEKRAERIAADDATLAKAKNRYRRELEWMRRMPQARGGKARYRKDAFYNLEQQVRRPTEEATTRLEVKSGYIGSKIFEAQYVSKSFLSANGQEKRHILKDFYYHFSRYEKMGIVGANGTGKSTFIRLLLGELQPDEGRFIVGETVRFGYFSQADTLPTDGDRRVIDIVRDVAEYVELGGGRRLTAMQLLTHFLFPPARQQDHVYKLSGGERRRLQLCVTLMQNPNFLILDEPTNDLDIPTLQILEDYLCDFSGCVIVVSHDRYFMDKVVDHLLVFHGDARVTDFPGNYTQYRQHITEQDRQAATTARDKKTASAPEAEQARNRQRPPRLTFKQKKELEALTAEIETLTAEKESIETALCSGTLTTTELTEKSRRLPQLTALLDEKEMRWLELSDIEA